MLTDTVIDDPRWHEAGLAEIAETAARATLGDLGLDPERFEIVVLGCNDARIAELNADFRGRPAPTNVLSWPEEDLAATADGAPPSQPDAGQPDDPEPLGNIAIAFETCSREAAAQGKAFSAHSTHLVVHAVLHLLGYDHVRDADATLMETTEIRILGNLGLADPYKDAAAT